MRWEQQTEEAIFLKILLRGMKMLGWNIKSGSKKWNATLCIGFKNTSRREHYTREQMIDSTQNHISYQNECRHPFTIEVTVTWGLLPTTSPPIVPDPRSDVLPLTIP